MGASLPARRFLVAGLLFAAGSARADPALSTRIGESGLLDVPTADTLGLGGGAFSLELRYLKARDLAATVGPSAFAVSLGLGRVEAGFSLREGGVPGDARPLQTTATGSGKLSLLEAHGKRPALALDLLFDQINHNPTAISRAIVSSERIWRTRAALFGGGVLGGDRPSGWTAGAALSLLGPRQTDLVLEFVRLPAGRLAGAALRWQPHPQYAFGLGASYLPDDARALQAGITIAFLNPAPPRRDKSVQEEKVESVADKSKAGKRSFADERPHFRLQLRERPLPGAEGGPARHYPGTFGPASEPEQKAAPAEKSGVTKHAPKPKAAKTNKVLEPTKPMPAADLPSTIPVLRSDHIIQRKVLAAVVLTLPRAHGRSSPNDREAIKLLALRAAKKEGDLLVWATGPKTSQKQIASAVARALTIRQLAVKLGKLAAPQVEVQVGPGEAKSSDHVLLVLLAPETAAAPAQAKTVATPPGPEISALAGAPSAQGDAGVPPGDAGALPSAAESPPATPPPAPDAGPAPGLAEPPAPETPAPSQSQLPDAGSQTRDAAPDLNPPPAARVERPVPLPSALKEGAHAEDQLRKAIEAFQPALKQCVDRALKRDPGLRGEGQLTLAVLPSGRVKRVTVRSQTLTGGWFEACLRRSAESWRMPRTAQGYAVEIPLRIVVDKGDAP